MSHRLIRNAGIEGRIADIAIEGGVIVEIGEDLRGEELFDASGGAALPGLHDHHIHLLATAAMLRSVQLDDCPDAKALAAQLRTADAAHTAGEWLRATGYHERTAGALDRHALDSILPHRPLRIQHQTGALWMLNSVALRQVAGGDWPASVERDAAGEPTGRIFRGDAWLRARLAEPPPDLRALGAKLARYGITGVTDASISNDATSAALLAHAVRSEALPLNLTLMAGGALDPPEDGAFAVGPVKILLDDHALPQIDDLVATIRRARVWERTVAAHCVTAGELAVMLAAFQEAGSLPGDRIEHGSVIPHSAIEAIAALQLTVVTQPGLIHTRGDRYRALVAAEEQPDLYRCASLIAAGIPVAGSSDAPYGDPDPWKAMRAAVERVTAEGHPLGRHEAMSPERALDLFLAPLDHLGGAPRRVEVGAPADLCILATPLSDALDRLDHDLVAATLHQGALTPLLPS